jgi:hypothetical protein
MTNLCGKDKEPLWQLASTNLVTFVILRRKTVDALCYGYEHVTNNRDKLRLVLNRTTERTLMRVSTGAPP